MRSHVVIFLIALSVAACAVPEKQTDVAATDGPPRERCEPQTGSNLSRCNRGDVSVVSREEAERQRQLSNPAVPTTSSPTRGSTH